MIILSSKSKIQAISILNGEFGEKLRNSDIIKLLRIRFARFMSAKYKKLAHQLVFCYNKTINKE